MLEQIVALIENGDLEQAWSSLTSYLSTEQETSETDVLKASILLSIGTKTEFFEALQRGFERNYKNYELYVLLAEYYSSINPSQAYICLRQALYYCDNPADKESIESQIKSLNICDKVRNTSIIILSFNTKDTTKMCLDFLFENCNREEIEVIVVDNASVDDSVEMLKNYPGIKLIENAENRGFPGGCNDGIASADKNNDILLLNSDALLLPNSLFWLKMGLYEAKEVGCTGSVTNYAGNYQMIAMDGPADETVYHLAQRINLPMECPYSQKIFLIGFSMLIKKEAMDKVGVLDERFNPGNFEDTDYGIRMIEAGFKMMLCKNSFVYHFGHKSFEILETSYKQHMDDRLVKFIEKWGFDVRYYTHTRSDLVNFINRGTYDEFNVLEVGCGCGCTIGYLEGKYPNAKIEGIELDEAAAKLGSRVFKIYQDNFETPKREYKDGYYDYVIFGDVLERLYNPAESLKKAYRLLKPDGYVITSIPNVMHASVLGQLLNGRFDYEDSGILDRTHIRFFTLETIIELFMRTGYEVKDLSGVMMTDGLEDKIDKIMSIVGENVTRSQLETYQYYIFAKKK